jgi:hypothetical protein
MPDSEEFDKLVEAQKRGEGIAMDRPRSSAELDTRRSKSGLASSLFTGGADDASQPVPAHDPAAAGGNVDIIYGDGDEGANYVGPVTATAHTADVALGPRDVQFGDQDQGVIAMGPPAVAVEPHAAVASAPAGQDIIFTDGDEGGTPVDLSAFAGRSNISAEELAGWTSAGRRESHRRRATDGGGVSLRSRERAHPGAPA